MPENVTQQYPWLQIDYESKSFWEGCSQRRLLISRCDDCGHWIHYPRLMCPKCWSENVTPTKVSGQGTVYTFVLYHQGNDPQIDYSRPYPVLVVELPEQRGLRITATMVGCDNKDIYIDMPVELTWIERQGAPIPAFQPAPGALPRPTA